MRPRIKRWGKVLVVSVCLLPLGLLIFALTLKTAPPLFARASLAISNLDDGGSVHDLAPVVEQRIQQWHRNLYLETYSATYLLGGEGETELSLTGDVYFHFVGRRKDLWGRWLSRFNTNHMIIDATFDVERGKLVDFSYSHGEPFGYDEPLRLTEWPAKEHELIQICDDFGGKAFREQHEVALAYVHARATRPGRFWGLSYSKDPVFFTCSINIDTGSIKIKREESDWQEVGNLYQME